MKTVASLYILVLLVFLTSAAYAQLVSISGTIQDNISGKTIRQISVVEGKSGIGTISSENGSYLLLLKKGEVKLSFSDDKYETYNTAFVLSRDTTVYVKLNAMRPETARKGKQGASEKSEYALNQSSRKK